MEISNRVAKWDNVKFFLILCVVIGHISEKYTQQYVGFQNIFLWIYTFHMPAFLFLSGLLSKKTILQKKWVTIFSYLLLYFFIKIVRNGVNYLINGEGNFSILSESGVAWYAAALFAYCLITIVLSKANLKWIMFYSVILGCMAGYDTDIGDWLVMSRIIVYYPFFLAGFMLDREKLQLALNRINVRIICYFIIIIFSFIIAIKGSELYWLRPLLTGRNPFSNLEMLSIYGGIFRLIYYLIVFILIFAFTSVIPNRRIPIFTNIGKTSIAIYAFHLSVIDVLWGGFEIGEFICMNASGAMLYVWMLGGGFLIAWLLSLPIFEKILRFFITPRLEIDKKIK